ncbi:THAP domain-containing protein 6-like [Rhagoletis pomonella]|uniref:THAP domain-containing protein 6-like n=1 Tax=Rhagoletis pomonella TaxID=28610 RepID=UPI0017826A22|nr:THAP domain-containing protein 6-like [Rhagoletis pomonella]
MRCQVLNCGNCSKSKGSNFSFYTFPTDEALSKKWVQFCRHDGFNTKTSVICMEHFREDDYQNLMQFNMGLAKRRLLKRGVVPSIYERGAVPSIQERETSAERYPLQDEFNVDYLLDQYNGENVLNESNCQYLKEEINIEDVSISPTHTSFYNDDSPQETDILKTEISYYYDNNQREVAVLETEIEALKRENALLKKDNKSQRIQLMDLKRQSKIQLKRHAWEIETLQKRLESMSNEVKNMEKKLDSMFTKGQIAALKSGSKNCNWSKEDIAHAARLYAAGPQAYKLMYDQNFPLPAISTLKIRTKEVGISNGQ